MLFVISIVILESSSGVCVCVFRSIPSQHLTDIESLSVFPVLHHGIDVTK